MTAEDSADLMNLVRLSSIYRRPKAAFRPRAHALAIYSAAVNAQLPLGEVLGNGHPRAPVGRYNFGSFVRALCRGEAIPQNVPRLRRSASLYWWQSHERSDCSPTICGGLRHILVDEYQDTNRLQASSCCAQARGGPRPARPRRDVNNGYNARYFFSTKPTGAAHVAIA